ncbi:MAG: hypothetical protein EPN47_13335 [Acidobacteria bacterium]|nr:MAG: hypothetical protein EPN47_13335 [Acidobacteriota bacterium]
MVFVAVVSDYPSANLCSHSFFARDLHAVATGLETRGIGVALHDTLENECANIWAAGLGENQLHALRERVVQIRQQGLNREDQRAALAKP